MLKKEIFRIGDRIKIINPEIVERVGYPLSFKEARNKVQDLYGKKVDLFLADIGFRTLFEDEFDILKMEADGKGTNEDKILNALAYEYVGKQNFGGNERKLFTKTNYTLTNVQSIVLNKRVVKTGLYFSPSGSYSDYYESEWEFEPGGLSKEKTHILLTIGFGLANIEIESCNVVKIRD